MIVVSNWRPDLVTRNGTIDPFAIRTTNPVESARGTIDPFINGIRPAGPRIAPQISAEAVAQAATAIAGELAQGKGARIHIGHVQYDVMPGQAVPGGLIGEIVKAANAIAQNQRVVVQSSGSPSVLVNPKTPTAATSQDPVVVTVPPATAQDQTGQLIPSAVVAPMPGTSINVPTSPTMPIQQTINMSAVRAPRTQSVQTTMAVGPTSASSAVRMSAQSSVVPSQQASRAPALQQNTMSFGPTMPSTSPIPYATPITPAAVRRPAVQTTPVIRSTPPAVRAPVTVPSSVARLRSTVPSMPRAGSQPVTISVGPTSLPSVNLPMATRTTATASVATPPVRLPVVAAPKPETPKVTAPAMPARPTTPSLVVGPTARLP